MGSGDLKGPLEIHQDKRPQGPSDALKALHIPLNTKDKASQEHIKSACLSAEG